jgi:membrane fusion protein, multidrug efflux system
MGLCVRLLSMLIMTILAASLVGCGGQADRIVEPPPPDVTVSPPVEQEVTDNLEFTGTTAALESVEIRARVKGFLDRKNFEPGSKVKAGDLLFVIDRRPFKAKVDQTAATLESNKAKLELARVRAEKSKTLYATASVSELQLLEDEAKRGVEKGQVDMAQADLEAAQLDLDFTEVKTPISGRVGVNQVDVGNLVGAGDYTLLTHVVNDDSVYVYFNISERDLLKYKRKYVEKRKQEREASQEVKAFLALADEAGFPHEGVVDYLDPRTDPGTGTVRARAIFANKDGLLQSGLFARGRIPMETRKAFLVPDLAVGIDQRGQYVLVVNDQDVVDYRPVEVGQLVDRMRVIEKGVTLKDRIAVNGIQRARPGIKVNPIAGPTTAPSPASGASQPAKP